MIRFKVENKPIRMSVERVAVIGEGAYERGYEQGYNKGYSAGFSDGKTDGYNEGYSQGVTDGEATGYDKGYSEGFSKGYSDGYIKGKEDGITEGFEAGRKAEQDIFWDIMQNSGGKQNYYYAFSYDRFTDANFLPKYDIKCYDGTTPGRYVFYNASKITDTKVGIYANSNNAQYIFYGSGLVTIRLFYAYETTNLNYAFANCAALENITIGGVIGKNVSFKESDKLTHDSIISVINALSATTTGQTVTFSETAVNNAFETSSGAADGSTSAEWLALIDTKTNWNIVLA